MGNTESRIIRDWKEFSDGEKQVLYTLYTSSRKTGIWFNYVNDDELEQLIQDGYIIATPDSNTNGTTYSLNEAIAIFIKNQIEKE